MTQPTDFSILDCEINSTELIKKHVTLVSIQDPDSPLLSRIHHDLITVNFLDVNDIDSLESMRNYMRNASKLSKHCYSYNVVTAIDSNDQILGATIFGLFLLHESAFIKGEYTVVAPGARKYGTLEKLLNARLSIARSQCILRGIRGPEFVIIQICSITTDPNVQSLQRMWRIRGFRRIDLPFVQLPLRNDLASIPSFDLFLQPLTKVFFSRTYITSEEAKGIVNACCTFRDSDKALTEYKEYRHMKQYIEQQKRITLCR